MEAAWELYGPWIGLALRVGVPVVALGVVLTFLLDRASVWWKAAAKITYVSAAVVIAALVLYLSINVVGNAFATRPGR